MTPLDAEIMEELNRAPKLCDRCGPPVRAYWVAHFLNSPLYFCDHCYNRWRADWEANLVWVRKISTTK